MKVNLRIIASIAILFFMTSCHVYSQYPAIGVNLLQSRNISFNHPYTGESMARLNALGADHVAIVTFLEQDSANDSSLRPGHQVTDRQLISAIRAARANNLKTILKPQLLVKNSWAGEIVPENIDKWFSSYQKHIEHYAHIAERENVSAIVIGTEIYHLGGAEQWRYLIHSVRDIYSGKLTYAAHGLNGMERFAHWQLLDAVGVTLYPSLGMKLDNADIAKYIDDTLRKVNLTHPLPLWLLEIGQPSAQGSLAHPWKWQYLDTPSAAADMSVQLVALETWMQKIFLLAEDKKIEQVTLWNWFNDPAAGGYLDNGYTIQNKPAEQRMRCLWTGKC